MNDSFEFAGGVATPGDPSSDGRPAVTNSAATCCPHTAHTNHARTRAITLCHTITPFHQTWTNVSGESKWLTLGSDMRQLVASGETVEVSQEAMGMMMESRDEKMKAEPKPLDPPSIDIW